MNNDLVVNRPEGLHGESRESQVLYILETWDFSFFTLMPSRAGVEYSDQAAAFNRSSFGRLR